MKKAAKLMLARLSGDTSRLLTRLYQLVDWYVLADCQSGGSHEFKA